MSPMAGRLPARAPTATVGYYCDGQKSREDYNSALKAPYTSPKAQMSSSDRSDIIWPLDDYRKKSRGTYRDAFVAVA